MKKGFWLSIIGLALAATALWWGAGRLEGTAPEVSAPSEILMGQTPIEIEIDLQDEGSGIRSVDARLLHEAGSKSLLQRRYPGDLLGGGTEGTKKVPLVLELDPTSGMAPDGDATLVLQVRDWSLRSGLAGNRRELSIPVVIDTRPPEVSVESGVTYVHRGGAAAAVYRLAEPAQEDGVRAGGAFFPGYPHPSGEPD
ncbi:hypothetical protein MK280_18370, partial [Myxococcota bacterium]|nr:hypothetical protein [Myxococcota bacterium]